METNGDVFTKLKLTVEFNEGRGEKIDPATVHKRLPFSFSTTAKMLTITKMTATKTTRNTQKLFHKTISTATGHEQTQSVQICAETLKRNEKI